MSDVVEKTIKIKEIVDVKDAIHGIEEIKSELGKLSLGPSLQSEFDKLFQKIERNAEKANSAMASGFKNKGDVKAYEDAMRQISTGYDSIITKAKILSNSNKINLQVDDTAIKSLNSEMETLQKNISQAKDSLRTLKASTGRDMGNIAKKYKGGADSWNNAVQAFKDGDIQKTDDAIKVLENTIKGAQTKAQKSGKALSSDWLQKIKDVEALRAALENYKDAQNNIKASEGELAQKEKELNNIMTKGSALLAQTAGIGEQGAEAFREYARETVGAAKGTQQLNSELDHFKGKAAYFFGLSNAINLFKRAVRSAYDTVKDLDAVMTETAVVTDFDVGDMWSQLPEYTQRANELGVTIHDTYEAATLFYQQGLKTNEVMQISNETLKMARIAGLDAATASDRMTNALRGFNMELDKTSAQRVNDVYSKLAAITASNTDEISTAMTKVASLAHNANMEFETTAAFLAQIIESTRESAETAGTALKTVVARFSEVKKLYSKGELMGQDEEGEEIDVNKVSTALRSAGINLNEYLTGAKGLDSIFIELAEKWDSLDQVQQRYIATMAAGSRQQSRFIALMSDYKRTAQLVDAANNANGASQEQYNKTLESLQTKLARLKNAWNEFVLGLANSDAIKAAVDMLTKLITSINNLIKLISGKNAGVKMIASFFAAFAAFKIGSKLTGNKNPIANYFNALTETGAKKIADSARKVATVYGGSLTNALGDELNNKKNNFLNKFKPEVVSANYEIENMNSFRKGIYQSDAWKNANSNQKIAINSAIQTGEVEKVNEALKQQGLQLEINTENEEQYGVTSTKVTRMSTEGWQAVSKAALVFGTTLVAVGDRLESLGGGFETIGPIIKGLGVGLLTFGTIMSVTIPMMAQIGAAGVTAAIESIPIIGWITAIISAVIALGAAIYNIVQNNSAETKLERATEAAEKAAEAADSAKKAFNELNETWNKLDDKYEVINNATQGTLEWKNAVKELNDQVLELMNTYEGIEVKRNNEGILEITNRKQYTEAEQNKVLNAEATARISKIRQYEASQKVSDGSLVYNWAGDEATYKNLLDEYKEAGKLSELAGKTTEEIENLLNENYKKRNIYGGIVVANKAQATKVQDYAKNYERNQASIKSEQQALGAVALEKSGIDKNLQKYANTFLSNEYLDGLLKRNEHKYTEHEAKDKYASSEGYDNWQSYISYHPEDKELTDRQVLDKLISKDATNEASEQIKLFTSNLSKLNDENEKIFFEQLGGGALSQKQANTLSNYTDEQRKALYDSLGGNAVFGLDGFKNYFNEWFKTVAGEAASNFKVEDKYGEVFSDHLSKELTSSLDSGTFKNFTDNLASIYTASGTEGIDKIQESITKITNDPEQREALIKSLGKVDWASANSIRTLSNLTKEYGISEDAVDELEKQIIKLGNAATKVDLAKVTGQFKSLLGLSKKIQNGTQGYSFGEDQKKQLVEAGADESKFKINIETGEYNYTGVLSEISGKITQLINNTFDTKQIEKDIASGKAGSELSGRSLDTTEDKINYVRDYMLKADENSKINTDWLAVAAGQARTGNTTNIDKLIAIIDKDVQELENNQKKLNEYKYNKDVMQYQLNSGAINANEAIHGNKAALGALQVQTSSSAMPNEIRQQLLSDMNNENIYIRNRGAEMAGNLVDTFDRAKSFGVNVEELNAYVSSLQQINGLEKTRIDQLYQLGLAEMNYQKGQQSLYDSYDEWSKLIQKNGGIVPDGSIEQGRVFNKLNEDLKQMLNLSEKLPDDFLKSKDNVNLLKKAIKGDKDAVEKLRTAAAKVQLGKIDIKKEGLKDKITNAINELSKKMPDLKIGATLDSTEAGKGLMDFVNKAGMSVEDIQKLFNSLGWAPEIKWLDLSYTDATKAAQSGTVYQRNPDGSYEPVKLDGEETLDASHSYSIPQIGPKTSKVASKPPKKNPPKKKSKGKGGGKKSKAKKERWENPYDELYNLQEKINESLRKREALERRYQKLLKQEQSSLSDIRKSYYDQIKQIRTEANLQKELEAGRRRQIENLGKQTYVDSKGNVKTFEQMGVTKYAGYNFETGQIELDWGGLQALEGSKNVEKGKAAEAFISKLEELTKSYEEVRDKLWELEDKIEEYRQAVIDTFLSFEDRVMDAVVNKYQKEIDSYQAMSDAIDKVNNEVLSSLREQIDLSRQIRDNTKKEEDISKKENRLAYLRRDTSGANDLEILSLEKELKDAREGYADTLVDQTIDKLQDDADKASEQRQRQIETMQAQLKIAQETGELWNEVYDLMNKASESEIFSEDSELAKILKDGEAFKSLSNLGQLEWWKQVGEAFHQAIIGRGEAEDKYQKDVNNDGTVENTGTSDYLKEINEMNTQANVTADTYDRTDEQNYGAAAAIIMGGKTHGGWGANRNNWESNLKEKGFDPSTVLGIYDVFAKQKKDWDAEQTKKQKAAKKKKKKYTKDAWTGWKTMGVTDWKKYQMSQFKTGGLADTTGPAWLDGTKTNPELVLNAKDTRNFIALKDILASLLNLQGAGGTVSKGGDNYFDINISADIGSDYDVDKLASRIKKKIFDDGQYRNVNTINYLR